MRDFLLKVFNQFKTIYGKLTKTQRLVAVGILAGLILALVLIFTFAAKPTMIILYKDLTPKDFGVITKKLQEWGYKFTVADTTIFVRKEEQDYIKMKLFQEGIIPEDIKGWELFDIERWTTTDFERDINKRRAIIGEVTRHLKTLKEDIEDVSVEIAMPPTELYLDKEEPYKASVIITPAPYSDITENPKKIRAIVNLVAFAVDRLRPENVRVFDHRGNDLTYLITEEEKVDYLRRTEREWRITEQIRQEKEAEIKRALRGFLGEEAVDVKIGLELDFDQKEIEKKEIIPIEMKKDNPLTPYDESEVIDKITISEKTTKEKFKGPGFIPEGPPGVVPNLPPGYKEQIGKWAEYSKDEDIKNYESSRMNSMIRPAVKIKRQSAAVVVDGIWEKEYDPKGRLIFNPDGTIKRRYIPRTDEELKKFTDLVKGAINFDDARGDMVVVRNVAFNWRKKWEKEDAIYRTRAQIRRTLVVAMFSLFILFLATLAYRALMRELARRRRIREEELAAQQQMIREAALRAAEKEGIELQLSLEERARIEMLENAINLAKEKPEDVASLLRTWLAEE